MHVNITSQNIFELLLTKSKLVSLYKYSIHLSIHITTRYINKQF